MRSAVMARRGLAVAAMAALAGARGAEAATSFCDEAGWTRVWGDEFDGPALDSTSWTALNGTREGDSSCRDAVCLSNNVAVAGGALRLTARAEARDWAKWTTGAVNSQNKRFWQATGAAPLRVCVSGELPGTATTGAGLWPAFWMMPNDASCWPDHGELDILEMINGDGVAHGSYHWATGPAPCMKTCVRGPSSEHALRIVDEYLQLHMRMGAQVCVAEPRGGRPQLRNGVPRVSRVWARPVRGRGAAAVMRSTGPRVPCCAIC